MINLKLKSVDVCKFDLISLGEVMLRLDPGEGRIKTARSFNVWEGGGEYNVARGLRSCFRKKTSILTALTKNQVGFLIEDLILHGGVDTSLIFWSNFDGIGKASRNGLNFTERGFGIRGAVGCSDRGHTAISQIKPGQIDWEHIFGKLGVRWFHTGGSFAGLSETSSKVIIEAMEVAKLHGTIISYDLNYRPSLWRDFGGVYKCQEINKEIAPYVDIMLGNISDFATFFGFERGNTIKTFDNANIDVFKKIIETATAKFPNLLIAAATIRKIKSASINDWSAICWNNGDFFSAPERINLEILDRVGGGDGFAAGLIYGLMEFSDPQKAVEYGAAHGALTMTTPGDNSMVSLSEIENLIDGDSSRIER